MLDLINCEKHSLVRGVRPCQDYRIVKHLTGDCYKSYVWLDGEMKESYPSKLN